MFEPTIPFGEPELMRVSAFQRYLDELVRRAGGSGITSRLSSLSLSLMEDLLRFERDGRVSEPLEVMAACVRHAQRVTVHLRNDTRVVPLTIFPQERLVHCPVELERLLTLRLTELEVLHVEPALLRPPGDPEQALIGDLPLYRPLGTLLWDLALRGGRGELLPEIAGPAAYRVSPGLDLTGLNVSGSMLAAVQRLRRETTNLRDLSRWPGFDRERAMRLLNALYLQAGLIVSRTHPNATSESWFGGLGL
jgi:hypothetical protein